MHERVSATVSGGHRRQRSNIFIVVALVCALVLAIVGNTIASLSAYAASQPGGNVADPVVRSVDIARPSVVRIITTLSGHLTVQQGGKDTTYPQTGAMAATPTTSTASNGNSNSNGYQVQLSGSGTFISSKGDILTADHVVNPPKDQALLQEFYLKAAPDIANDMSQGNTQVTADQVNQRLNSGTMKSTLTIDSTSSEVFLSTDYSGPLTITDFNALPASLHATVDKIEKESASDQKDVAIIHAPFTDTPSVQLDDSSTVQPLDELTIIGFPGNGDVNPSNPGDLFTSSINKISVSSIKTTSSGAPVIQVGGNVEHGDSGGPALDKSGSVVGIVSFGLATPGASGTSGTSFLQASNSAREMIQSLNLDTTPGTFQKSWSQAFNDYAASTPGHWHKAQQEFQQLSTAYPQFKAVTPYLTYTQQQASTEAAPTPQSTQAKSAVKSMQSPAASPLAGISQMVWIAGAVAVLLLLAIALFAVSVRRRGKNTQQGKPEKKQETPLPTTQGASPPVASSSPVSTVQNSVPPTSTPSGTFTTMRVWPCGHMNRPNARFCSVCGELAPQQPTRP
jgi:Trypsin-like peptidase domain